jgi:hypothetical protein
MNGKTAAQARATAPKMQRHADPRSLTENPLKTQFPILSLHLWREPEMAVQP